MITMKPSILSSILPWLILALGSSLRLYKLAEESIWFDEAYSISLAQQGLLKNISDLENNTPPLYQVLLQYWIQVFGSGEHAVRLLSCLCGIGAIYAIYRLGRMTIGEKGGLIAAFLLAISSFHIEYSQEARTYALFVLLAILSCAAYWRLCTSPSRKSIVFYVASTALLAYSHNYALFVILSQNLHYFLLRVRHVLTVRKWLTLQGCVCALFLPWIVMLVQQVQTVGARFWIPPPDTQFVWQTILSYSNHFWLICPLLIFLFIGAFSVSFAEATPVARRGRSALDNWRAEVSFRGAESVLLFALWIFCITAVPLLLSLLLFPMYFFKYSIAGLPAFYLWAAKGIVNLRRSWFVWSCVGIIALFSTSSLADYYEKPRRRNWRQATNLIDESKFKDVDIVFPNYVCRLPFDYYYSGSAREVTLSHSVAYTSVPSRELLDYVAAKTNQGRRFWCILCRIGFGEEELEDLLKNNTAVLFRKTIGDRPSIGIFLCDNYLDEQYRRGVMYMKMARQKEGMEELAGEVKRNDDHARAHAELASLYWRQGQLSKAIVELEKIIRLFPTEAEMHYNLGVVRSRNGQVNEAITSLEAATRIEPEWAQAHLDLGSVYFLKGRLEEAIAEYKRAVGIEPGSIAALNVLGLALMEQGSLREARRCLQKAVRVSREEPQPHRSLALVYRKMGKDVEAEREMEIFRRLQERKSKEGR